MRRFNSRGLAAAFEPAHRDLARRGRQQAGHHLDGGGFARPVRPRKAQMLPAATSRLSPLTAVNSPKRRVRFRQEIISSIVTGARHKTGIRRAGPGNPPRQRDFLSQFRVDVVLTGVQPEEIALNPAGAGAAGDSRSPPRWKRCSGSIMGGLSACSPG